MEIDSLFNENPVSVIPSVIKSQTFQLNISFNSISYTISKTCLVSAKYFDLHGRVAGTYVNQIQNPGNYNIKMQSDLAQGIYLLKFQAGDFITNERFIIVR